MAVPSRRNSGLEMTSKFSSLRAVEAQGAADPLIGEHGNRALLDHYLVLVEFGGNLTDRGFDEAEIGLAGGATGAFRRR